MSLWHAILLGLVQGVTEFLPISSSGHLVIVQNLLGYPGELIFFDILLHVATLLAILTYYNVRLPALVRKHWRFVGIATIPAIVAGVLLAPLIEEVFGSLSMVSMGLFVTAGLLYASQSVRTDKFKTRMSKAWWMGIFQAIAIFPGISRSGVTISASRMSGIELDEAFDLSFLMSIPVIAGAMLFQVLSLGVSGFGLMTIEPHWYTGMMAAAISGVISLRLLKAVLLRDKFHYFAGYCLFVSGVLLLLVR